VKRNVLRLQISVRNPTLSSTKLASARIDMKGFSATTHCTIWCPASSVAVATSEDTAPVLHKRTTIHPTFPNYEVTIR